MRSERDLQHISGYVNHSREFADLMHVLDNELRLITPTDPEGSDDRLRSVSPGERFYQLTHDYLVHSLLNWLTRKQRESRRGRAELRLAERSAAWNAKSENRHLPSAVEWTSIRLLTRKKDWNAPQRKMMKRAGRLHRARGVLTVALLGALVLAGIGVLRRFDENRRATYAAGLVARVLDAETAQVPEIVSAMREYRQIVDPVLLSELQKSADGLRQQLHASLALLPADATQIDYLFNRLLSATPRELPVFRDALKSYRSSLTPKLWNVLEKAKPGDANLLPAASALASYDPDNDKWDIVGTKVAQALVSVDAIFLGLWIEALHRERDKLTAPLTLIFRDNDHSESERKLATNILANYASDKTDLLAELLMNSDHKAYQSLFPVAKQRADEVMPLFQAELAKEAMYTWNEPPFTASWTTPDAAIDRQIESAQGILSERFAFCQTMPIDDFLTTAQALSRSGYRPVRFRPYPDGQVVRVAAVWNRDGRPWRSSPV